MIKLVSWNIQSARRRPGDGWARIVDALAGFSGFADVDILCLQEVAAGFGGGDGFAALAARLPGYHAAGAAALDVCAPDGGRRRLGCMTLSRYPLVQVLRHSLPWPADLAVPSMPRIALEVTLDTPSGLLRVLNAHLEYFSEAQRLAQVDALRTLHRDACAHARAPRPGPDADPGTGNPFAAIPRALDAVLAGDFNMLPGSPSWRRLLAPFDDGTPAWHDAWALAHPERPHAPTVGVHGDAPFTFDYAFVGAGLAGRVRTLRVDDGAGDTDHQALLLELG
jgi:endonuclease/exonuclease/phosphatase family metal-dependent hydrolase